MFFHTPFPSSELWLVLARRDELIRGILNCDQVGFHLYEYARHFLTTCRRLLGTPYEMNPSGTLTVTIDGREVAVTCMHIGVDLARVEHALSQPVVPTGVAAWRHKFQNKIVIAGAAKSTHDMPRYFYFLFQFAYSNIAP
jgi:trehalose 6-phosphate synthase/phosphatase